MASPHKRKSLFTTMIGKVDICSSCLKCCRTLVWPLVWVRDPRGTPEIPCLHMQSKLMRWLIQVSYKNDSDSFRIQSPDFQKVAGQLASVMIRYDSHLYRANIHCYLICWLFDSRSTVYLLFSIHSLQHSLHNVSNGSLGDWNTSGRAF